MLSTLPPSLDSSLTALGDPWATEGRPPMKRTLLAIMIALPLLGPVACGESPVAPVANCLEWCWGSDYNLITGTREVKRVCVQREGEPRRTCPRDMD